MDSSKDYEITIFVARIRITVAPIFAHQPIGIWTSVNNFISCATYSVCRVQHITKTAVTTVVQHSNLYHTKYREVRFKINMSCPDIHIPPDCYVAKQYTTISIFPVSPIRCIGCNRSNSCRLATEIVDIYVVAQKLSRGQ